MLFYLQTWTNHIPHTLLIDIYMKKRTVCIWLLMLWNPESEEIAAIMVRRFGKMVSTDI